MEKLGVVLDNETIKTASRDKVCPKCGRALKVPQYCDVCGTEPFEKRPDPQPPKKE